MYYHETSIFKEWLKEKGYAWPTAILEQENIMAEHKREGLTQDNPTLEKIREKLRDNFYCDAIAIEDITFLLDQLKSLDGVVKQHEKRIYDLSEELRQAYEQLESQNEITAALHIVNAELGRRVESQNEEITALNSRMHTCPECGTENGTHHSAACVDKRDKEVVEQTARDCAEIAEGQRACASNPEGSEFDMGYEGASRHIAKAIVVKYSLPKEE